MRLRTPGLLSVVVPCFNEEQVLAEMHRRLSAAVSEIGLDYEIIFVNDGSSDRTLAILRQLNAVDQHVKVVSFARNFGHQMAVTAGIDFAAGDAVVLIDADLQDPPELIPEMVRMWRDGAKVIYGVRESRAAESAFKRFTAMCFYRVINAISEVEIPCDTGDFRLIDRCVVDVLKQMPERHRFVRGMVSWIGFQQTPLRYARSERLAGSTKYSLSKMIHFAFDAIISFSLLPLRLATILGLCMGAAAVVELFQIVWQAILGRQFPNDSQLSVFIVTVSGSLILVCLGIVGEYLGRIYSEMKRRPLYVVSELHGLRTSSAAAA